MNPQGNILPEYPVAAFTPCGPYIFSYDELNPWQVVWNQSTFYPDPYQQLYNFQDNWMEANKTHRRIYSFLAGTNYSIIIQQEQEYCYFTYGNFIDDNTGQYIPSAYVGTSLSGINADELIGTGFWIEPSEGRPYEKESPAHYQLRIKRDVPPGTVVTVSATGLYNNQIKTVNYNTRIEIPSITLYNDTQEDTLLHYYSREISFYLRFQDRPNWCIDGWGGAYPVGTKFAVEIISGQEYGNLYYPGTVADPEQSGTSITNLDDEYGQGVMTYGMKYKADGVQPDSLSPGIVTIRCSANDADIAPVEISFPVKYNTDPPEEGGIILVDFNKESFSPGDTATANCKWLTAFNELVDFTGEQSFNVEITGGNEFGILFDPNTGTVADNLQGVSNGFKVITATSIPYDSVVIRLRVNTSVEVNSSQRMITNEEQNTKSRATQIADTEEGTQTVTPDLLIGNPGQEIEGFGDVVVKKDECDEEIVVCNNYQPLKFEDVGTITVLKSDTTWQWIDDQGTPQTTNTGNACNFNPQPGEYGKTYIMPKIGDFAPGNPVYNLLDDTEVTVCLDNNIPTDPFWRYGVENLRVPIFRDHCPVWPNANGYIDLLDGTNADTLAKYIKNCSDYTKVTTTLDWWWIGPYRQQGQAPPHKFYFSTGVIAHENIHVKQMKDGGTKYFPIGSIYNEMNNGKYGFRTLVKYIYSANIAKCPEDALIAVVGTGTMEERIKIQLDAALTTANDLISLGGQDNQGRDNSELEADELARPKYDEIKMNIENWAKQQSWWCIPWPIVGDDYYRGCDQSKCTP